MRNNIGDEAGTKRYEELRDALTKLLYNDGKDVQVARAAKLLDVIKDFEQDIIKRGVGPIKEALVTDTISQATYDDASKINWWRTKGLPGMKPTDMIPSSKYAEEIYGPALNVINSGAYLANAMPTMIEKLYVGLGPLMTELDKIIPGVAKGAGRLITSTAKGALEGLGLDLTVVLLIAAGAGAVYLFTRKG